MLEELTIRNFQPHKKLKVRFDPNVTTIVGRTDTGKSSILRALRWIALNRPDGEAFIRQGADSTKIKLNVDQRGIQRGRGAKSNYYKLDGKRLVAFNKGVPHKIQKLLDTNDINFQGQHDAPFWFSNTAGEVSRRLNEIVNIDIIDMVLARLNMQNRDTQAEEKVANERLAGAKQDRDSLRYAKAMDGKLGKLEALTNEMGEHRDRATRLQRLLEEAFVHAARAFNLRQALAATVSVASKGTRWQKLESTRGGLALGVRRAGELAAASITIPDAKGLEKLYRVWHALEEEREDVFVLYEQAVNYETYANATVTNLELSQKEFGKIIGKECPLCGEPTQK